MRREAPANMKQATPANRAYFVGITPKAIASMKMIPNVLRTMGTTFALSSMFSLSP
jgi:hypothetical protein